MSNNVNNNFKSRLCVWRKIMKFTTFLKVFAISLAVFVGATGIGIGILAIAGFFNKPIVQPENMVLTKANTMLMAISKLPFPHKQKMLHKPL